jgi:hypothetical protein
VGVKKRERAGGIDPASVFIYLATRPVNPDLEQEALL